MEPSPWTRYDYKADKTGLIMCGVNGFCLACLLWEAGIFH
jgi:hypothetical protein